MNTKYGVCTLAGGAPRLRYLGVLHGAGLSDETPPLDQLCPSLFSLGFGAHAIFATEEEVDGSRIHVSLEVAAYIEATERLFGPLCSTFRHLALDGPAGNLAAWDPLLQKCGALCLLRIYNIRAPSFPFIGRLDLPPASTSRPSRSSSSTS